MDSKSNPFRFGGDLGADELVDRVEETALVESTIRNGEKLFLIGPRRFGKTSILRSADENLTAVGAVVLRLDAEAYPTGLSPEFQADQMKASSSCVSGGDFCGGWKVLPERTWRIPSARA